MPFRSMCVKCKQAGEEKRAVLRWTLFNGNVSVVAPLCMEHGQPLSELVSITGPKPNLSTGTIPKQPLRIPKARPLTGWVKPEDD